MNNKFPSTNYPLPEQFRMNRLQVFNWGTFDKKHDIAIASKGFLFLGPSGTGKSTLLDAFSALLIPPRWIDFNAAARETDRSGRDRNLVTYIRGAYTEQKDNHSGEIITRFLRGGHSVWSALALTYTNGLDHIITLVQIFWIRGNSTNIADVKRYYLIFERAFDLSELTEFSQTDFNVSKLKQQFTDAFIRDEFRSYCDRFCRLMGIENEMVLRLLHKTQSAKNLGDLNIFLRDFMLDKPKTFEVADQLISEFDELNTAHQTVITAREQIQLLIPARTFHQELTSIQLSKNKLDELQQSLSNYLETLRIKLLTQHIAELDIQIEGIHNEILRMQDIYNNHTNLLRNLEQQHRKLGGDRIEQWEFEKKDLENQRDERLRKQKTAKEACQILGWTLSNSPQAFAELTGKAKQEIEQRENHRNSMQHEFYQLSKQKHDSETAFSQIKKEVEALRRQSSNIPANMLELRYEIAQAIDISEDALPFFGELIEVKPAESSWQGAIERVLYGFALSLLVSENHYSALGAYVNRSDLKRLLRYERTDPINEVFNKPLSHSSLIFKLNVKEGNYTEWLQKKLRQRFDYLCADSLQAFRQAERAVTKEGQIKHNKTRHEKDDRFNIHDRTRWILGFNNQQKRAYFEKQAQDLAETIIRLEKQLNQLSQKERDRENRLIQCQTLVNLHWQEIDPSSLLTRIEDIEQLIHDAKENNLALQALDFKLNKQKEKTLQAESNLQDIKIKLKEDSNKRITSKNKLTALKNDPAIIPPTPYQSTELEKYYAQQSTSITLDNIDKLTTRVSQSISQEQSQIVKHLSDCTKKIENILGQFNHNWPMESANLHASLDFAKEYFSKLARLESDGLPKYEHRFFKLLRNQSHQNLAALSTYLNDARKSIFERIETVNHSLRQVPFNRTLDQHTYLLIEPADRPLTHVKEFKQQLQDALSYAWNESNDNNLLAENQFNTLRLLVARLSSQDPAQKNWKEVVLDVRQHIEFIAREITPEGTEVAVYRSGSGKSGGERQKLAIACLAAALRYQLGGNEQGAPLYTTVVLDEAFDKADNEFTALSMNIFANFGFQMVIATPLKSIMTLEPFIGGACIVNISEANPHEPRKSGIMSIEYDTANQKLQLSLDPTTENNSRQYENA